MPSPSHRLWVNVFGIASQINLAQALNELEKLAGQLGLPGGLAAWEALAQQMGEEDMQNVSNPPR